MTASAPAREPSSTQQIDAALVQRLTDAALARSGTWNKQRSELRFRCPEGHAHTNGDADPSARWNCAKGVWRCDVCRTGGGAVDLAKRLGVPLSTARVVCRYDYRDADGVVLFQVERLEPRAFRQRRPDGRGGWIYNLDGVRRRVYRLPELLAADPALTVHICEGEKDCDRLAALELVATTNPQGAGKWSSDYTAALKGRSVVILPDNDAPGRAHADQVAAALTAAGSTVRVLALPGLPEKGDVSNWLDAGGTADELAGLVAGTPVWTGADAAQDDGGARALDLADFLRVEFPPRENIIDPVFPRQGLGMIHAWRGLGKTYLSANFGLCAAAGAPFLKWKIARPWNVLFVDGEMRGDEMQERLCKLAKAIRPRPAPGAFRIITPDLQGGAIPDLATPAGQRWLDAELDDRDLVILDNLSCLVRSGTDKEDELWLPLLSWLLRLRASGRSVLLIHHDGKNETQRGTSRREDQLDTVFHLKKPRDYKPSNPARFVLHFEKHRGFYGKDSEPFEAALIESPTGALEWTITEFDDALTIQVAEMLKDGCTVSEIVKELKMGRATVDRHKQKAIEKGLL